MITARFRSLGWVAAVAVSALACYLVTQRVAAERIQLARVSKQILATERDKRRLSTEIETRGRLSQVERWNQDVLALAAPEARQFLASDMQLAGLEGTPGAPALPLNPAAAPPPSVRQASYVPPPAAPSAEEAQPVLRHTTYEKPPVDKVVSKPERLALDDGGFAADLDRLAALEAKRGAR